MAKTTFYWVELSKKALMEYLKTRGFDLWIWKTRGFTKLYNKKRRVLNYKGKLEHPCLTFDLTAQKFELRPGVFIDELTQYLCDLVEHEKTRNIAQFDRWNYWEYKNPYKLHD